MERDEIVPDCIDKAPSAQLTIIYNGQELSLGGELSPFTVKDQPEVKWVADPSKYYLLVMIDPDAPSRQNPIGREVLHWLIGNISGNDLKSGNTIAEYIGSGPPKDTGLHRYIFLLYEQNEKIAYEEPYSSKTSREHRFHFSIRKFAQKYNLGDPVFGNYYLAQWDEYVDQMRKERDVKMKN